MYVVLKEKLLKNFYEMGIKKIEAGIKHIRDNYNYILVEEKNNDISIYIEKNGLIKFVIGFVYNQKMYVGNTSDFYSDVYQYVNSPEIQEESILSFNAFCKKIELI